MFEHRDDLRQRVCLAEMLSQLLRLVSPLRMYGIVSTLGPFPPPLPSFDKPHSRWRDPIHLLGCCLNKPGCNMCSLPHEKGSSALWRLPHTLSRYDIQYIPELAWIFCVVHVSVSLILFSKLIPCSFNAVVCGGPCDHDRRYRS